MSRKNIRHREIEQSQGDGTDRFEYKPANRPSHTFKTGFEMWRHAVQCNPKLETEFNDKTGPFLCDWFERRRKPSNN